MTPSTMEELKPLADAVRPTSPALASALGGASAGVAVAALARSLLKDAQAAPGDVLKAAQGTDASTRNSIVAAEQSCDLRLRQSGSSLADLAPDVAKAVIDAGVQLQKQGFVDTEGARARQLASHDRVNEVLAYGVSLGFLAVLLALLFGGTYVNQGVYKDLLFTLLGVLGTGWANIIGFYFGSSAGSAQKTQAMSAALIDNGGSSGPSA